MIDRIYAAPKFVEEKDGIGFAEKNELSYEIPAFMFPEFLENMEKELPKYKKKIQKIKGPLSIHGPIFDMNPVSLEPAIKEISQKRYRQAIEGAIALGAEHVVFHTQYSPLYRAVNAYEDWLVQNVDYWQEAIEDVIGDANITVLMENFMDETPDILNDMVSRIDSPKFKACLDTGHVNVFSKVPSIRWLDDMGDNLVYIHAHNNCGETDDHHAIQEGTIDMEGFLNHLVMVPHEISLALEVFNMPGINDSYDYLQPFMDVQEQEFAETRSFLI